jgi:DNA-methyltransferase (dcm)
MLKVFEAFAGYGSQRLALKNINFPHEIVGISEIDGDVILSYAAIHENLLEKRTQKRWVSESQMRTFLEKINVPLNYKTFKNRAESLRGQKLKDMYVANKISRNFGDIRIIDPHNLPDFDLFTYSFPCQDISVAGYQNGLNPNSGTRSSLLWECLRIIEIKKPKYLMMENVKNLVGKNHIKNFEDFLLHLKNLGYTNYFKVLNARDYGIPQNRERVFCISILGDHKDFVFPPKQELSIFMNDLLETSVPDSFYLAHNQVSDTPISQKYIYCLDSNYWKGTFLRDFLKKKRRQLVSGPIRDDGKYPARRLTPRETWRFMGVDDSDFNKASELISNTSLYKQSGNSIVVPVLEAVFTNLFQTNERDNIMTNKERIIELFRTNVKGNRPNTAGINTRHDGREGHWLERQFGVQANGDNAADLLGYELKNETTSKTTFGDWSANRYIFKQGAYAHCFNGRTQYERKDSFCAIFGKPNPDKNGRCSWSGSPCPTIHGYNDFGQKLVIDNNKDIVALYSYSKDKRVNKFHIVPSDLHQESLELARWFGISSPTSKQTDKCLKAKLEDKFNDAGWFTCKKGSDGSYQKICFGEPINYENWLELVQTGVVFFDSGMYQGNVRPYSMWRANNSFWDSLITECFE